MKTGADLGFQSLGGHTQLDALQSLVEEFARRRKAAMAAGSEAEIRRIRHPRLTSAYREARERIAAALTALEPAACIVDRVPELTALESAIAGCLGAISRAQSIERDLRYEWEKLKPGGRRRRKEPPSQAMGYRVESFRQALARFRDFLASSPMKTMLNPLYFLAGPAGSGKTHLFLDAAAVALDEGRPAIVLFGGQFGAGDVWGSVCDQLGLPILGSDELLGALDAVADASSTSGRRCVIMIDALNETPNSNFWRVHLPAVRTAVRQWPNLALAVSCRDTYLSIVDDGSERNHYAQRTHPGFAGREAEAAHKFFAHYRLDAPRIPLITPEFTLPLFLRLYCEGLHEEGLTASVGHEGRVRIFTRFLKVKIDRIAGAIARAPNSDYVLARARDRANAALSALLDEMSSTGREAMPTLRGEELIRTALGGDQAAAIELMGVFQSEGVLTREHMYLGDEQVVDGVRIAFQAFADFLLLKRRLDRSSDVLSDDGIKEWLSKESSWGILEAAAVLFPEAYQTELPDFVHLPAPARPAHQVGQHESAERRRAIRSEHVFEAFFKMLPYREAGSIGERTIELLNACWPIISSEDFFDTMFLCSPQLGSRLNGDGLHRYLSRFKMPKRDVFFGIATFHQIWDETKPITRLARWAAAGPHPDSDPEVVRLTSTPLLWLMSSPNRFMRDWVTKALVQLLHGHLAVLPGLVRQFWEVDDPYIVQRVLVVACGSLLRGGDADLSGAKQVCDTSLDVVFSRPMTRPDELLLDAGRVIVRWGVAKGILSDDALAKIGRPYGLTIPGNPPTKEKLEARYGYVQGQPDEESYGSVRNSVLSYGDFGRYVIESGVRHFSRYRTGRLGRDRESRQPRLIKGKWKAFVASLSNAQRNALGDQFDRPDRWLWATGSIFEGDTDLLSADQHKLFDAAWKDPVPNKGDEYPPDRARRWVFMRTLSLGWTPKRFGRVDRSIGHGGGGRDSHKSERWGKKYQWMAYHELLARVADNYQSARSYSGSVPYEGLYQILGEREIDPTLPPIDYRSLENEDNEAPAHTWASPPVDFPEWPPIKVDFARYRGQIDSFLADHESEPRFDGIADVKDSSGIRWVLLEGYFDLSDPESMKSWLGLQQPTILDSWFVPAIQSKEFMEHVPSARHTHAYDILDEHGHGDCCYAGEAGAIPSRCDHQHSTLEQVKVDGRAFDLVASTESYMWEGNILDCSIRETVRASMPSTFVQIRTPLRWQTSGPTWIDAKGDPVVVYNDQSTQNASHGLLVRADWLRSFLRTNGLHLVWTMWWERRHLDASDRVFHPSVHQSMAGRLDASLRLHDDVAPVREAWPGGNVD